MGQTSEPAGGKTVEFRIRLPVHQATYLRVRAAVLGVPESEVVSEALEPLLRFKLPDVPEGPLTRRKKPGPAGGDAA